MEFDLEKALEPYGFVAVNKNVYLNEIDTAYATIFENDCFYLIPIQDGQFLLYQHGYYDDDDTFCHVPIPVYRFCLYLDFENDEEFIEELFARIGIDKELSEES